MPRPIIRAPIDGKCRVCGATEFGTRNRCKPCNRKKVSEARARDAEAVRAKDAARSRAWRKANPDKARAQKRRELYGLNGDTFDAMLTAQGGRCAICHAASPSCIDHCHVTGAVRGILCRPCNAGLGQFRDDPELLFAAAAYVEGIST